MRETGAVGAGIHATGLSEDASAASSASIPGGDGRRAFGTPPPSEIGAEGAFER